LGGFRRLLPIFSNFRPFSAEKVAFLKTNVMIQFLQKLAEFRTKNADFFSKFVGKNVKKIIPGHSLLSRCILKTAKLRLNQNFEFLADFLVLPNPPMLTRVQKKQSCRLEDGTKEF
jgi:hypothetical protein